MFEECDAQQMKINFMLTSKIFEVGAEVSSGSFGIDSVCFVACEDFA